MPRLTLCTIAHNDGVLLPQFLQATAELCDEVVAIDRGSTDNTVALLRQAGARILSAGTPEVPAALLGDAAALRNRGLVAAKGDYVVLLDPPDLPSPELVADARAVLADGNVGAAAMAVHERLDFGPEVSHVALRLLPRGLYLTHPVHPEACTAVLPALQANGKQLVQLRGRIMRTGTVDLTVHDARVDALWARLGEHPGDLYCWLRLMEQARLWQDPALWSDAAHHAHTALGACDAAALRTLWYGGECVTLIGQSLHAEAHGGPSTGASTGDSDAAIAFYDTWSNAVAPSAALYLRRGELHEACGRVTEAAADYERCLNLRGSTANVQLTGLRPLLGLSRLAMSRALWSEALEYLNIALTQNPRDPEALLALATVSRAAGGQRALCDVTAAYIQTYGDTPEWHGALGEVALRTGDAQAAIDHLRIAAGDAIAGPYAGLLDEALSLGD